MNETPPTEDKGLVFDIIEIQECQQNRFPMLFVDEIYDFDSLPMETFLQRRTLNKKLEDYKSTTDMMLTLAEQGLEVGIEPRPRTQYDYYKTKDGYRIKELVESKTELDVRYYWDIVSGLLSKFGLDRDVKKNPPLTILDKSQKSIMEWI